MIAGKACPFRDSVSGRVARRTASTCLPGGAPLSGLTLALCLCVTMARRSQPVLGSKIQKVFIITIRRLASDSLPCPVDLGAASNIADQPARNYRDTVTLTLLDGTLSLGLDAKIYIVWLN